VYAVGLVYLDIGQARVGEQTGELSLGERPGDAAGPLLHVDAGRVVHVLVGDHPCAQAAIAPV